ncbi:ATP-binding cassette domain-containing protein [Haloferax sp. MBLA0076]|uniref:Cobalamin import ATP-binding protein BtuD n=1 Tax=Haloferax litoreum TaxID=2666140 RepID=A0A6A8GEC5_9EURY|nr:MULTISPECIES: ABC transporter ATP-binding protein [Haloferax]KAB1192988.1 ABC transporter ATP-binding protein [Haloferax sp. CBA1148]MRX21478.1 ATP-binding cassette domain-containing protein [Haloferax litoreum]
MGDERTPSTGSPTASELVGENLAIGYPTTDEPVVECENVVIPAGEVTALVGPNGSGKSTLLKTMANQHDAEFGRVLVDGQRIQSFDSKELARRVGLLSQENESPASLTVEDLVSHGRYPHRGFFDSLTDEDRVAIDRAIELAGVEEIRTQAVGNLSGGQKQLAWIAMVLAQDTDVLLLDEPTTYLDLHHQLRVMEVVRTLNREEEITIGIVLHDIGQAARFADNLIAMKDGEPYDWGPPKEVVTEDLLADVFRVDADVDSESDTGPHIAPHRALD